MTSSSGVGTLVVGALITPPIIALPPHQKKLPKSAPARNEESTIMCDMISRHGNGFKPPSDHDLIIKLLNQEVELTHETLEEHRKEWRNIGCTIVTGGWTDRKRRTILNFLVNSPKEVGEDNVVQVVTNNAANYKAAVTSLFGISLMIEDKMLHWPLYAAANYLNPQMHYDPIFKADIEVGKDWWNSVEFECPECQRFAICKLNLTSSSSDCERNRSAFEMKGRRTFEIEFDDLGSDDDLLMDEDDDIEISDEDFIQMNQEQIQEDDILVHDLEDERERGIDQNEFDDDFKDENEDEGDNEDNDDSLSDYDKLQNELFGN
ncbi:hypothetical protein KIW84_030626 [Lathyrus oleraceus]|uniref:DUF659 domain-containing protein n=1 Tax=Pisum sativum TaxID=3888 RepID=A0A9D4XNL9_PEA|nr:hypothetical protein KIW84_030626 [Pisum sativum]